MKTHVFIRRLCEVYLGIALAALVCFPLLIACSYSRETVRDSRGRVFVKVRAATAGTPDRPGQAELWQEKGKTGEGHPAFLKLMGDHPAFTQTQ